MEDKILIEYIKSEDNIKIDKSLNFIYSRLFKKVEYYVNNNSGNEAETSDIFQEAIVIFYQNVLRGDFKQQATVETYVFSICKNLWRQQIRKKNMRTQKELLTDDYDIDNILINYDLLKTVFSELKTDCQNLLNEFYFEKKSIKELKLKFNMNSEQVVKNKKSRCIGYLMKIIEKRKLNKSNFFQDDTN